MEEDLDISRRLSRRRMAWIAFVAILLESVVMTAGLFLGGPVFAANAQAASTVLVGLFWTQAAVIGAYLGVSMTEAWKKQDPRIRTPTRILKR